MNDLLKEAIADAKAVRETALANAKIALEEAFTPRIQSMLSAKLAEEAEEEHDMDEEAVMTQEGDYGDKDKDMDETFVAEEEGMEDEPEMEAPAPEPEPEMEMEMEDDVMEDDLNLEDIIKELEADLHEEDLTEEPVAEAEEHDKDMDEVEESLEEDADFDINEIIAALNEEEDEEEVKEELEEVGYTAGVDDKGPALEEAYNVIKFMKDKLNEVNLLNAKLLFSNKLFRNFDLNENQKLKVIDNFDRAGNLREVKLIYATLCESFDVKKKKAIAESYASKPVASTKPSKTIIKESNQLADRFRYLAFGNRH